VVPYRVTRKRYVNDCPGGMGPGISFEVWVCTLCDSWNSVVCTIVFVNDPVPVNWGTILSRLSWSCTHYFAGCLWRGRLPNLPNLPRGAVREMNCWTPSFVGEFHQATK
jgi:hypothetical protein